MNKFHVLIAILISGIYTDSYADHCPSPETIRNRKLSQNYEWTVDEHTTLQELLSVKKLYAVRIISQDKYISCHYTTEKWPIKLDVSPASGDCNPVSQDGLWKNTDSGQAVCQEKDANKCNFSFECSRKRK